jgi:2-keto-4-pentenoate hydratase
MQPLTPLAILNAYDHANSFAAGQFEPFSDFVQAQRIAADVTRARIERGEKPVGYKIGFTNRNIWPLYGVSRPIWSAIYDTTVSQLPSDAAQISLGRFVEPRLEPEIVIGLKATPKDDSIAEILRAIAWLSHGFEIVQSHFPAWKFTAAEAHACQGLHGALLIGLRTELHAGVNDLVEALSAARMNLCLKEGSALRQVEQGVGANVLDGPVQALSFLVKGLAQEGKVLLPGEIITTGTLTDAKVMTQGQRWRSHWLAGSLNLSNLELDVV